MAIPFGNELGLLSAISGMPVVLEKRTVTGVAGDSKWTALDTVAASGLGVNSPETTMPFA